MWWQIIPSGLIVGTALYAPQVICYVAHSLFFNTPYLRVIDKNYEAHMFLRDYRLTGNVYKQNGLDCLKPLPETPELVEECIPVKKFVMPAKKKEEDD